MVGSDIELLCLRASKNAIRKYIKGHGESRPKELVLTSDDFEAALASIQSERP